MLTYQEPTDSPAATGEQGLVLSKTTGHYTVYVNGRTIVCELSNRLRKQLIYPTASPHSVRRVVRQVKEIEHTDPVAVGDRVLFTEASGGGLITDVLPRRNKLARRSAGYAFEQVIAANLDQVVCVFAAANPAPKWGLLDRALAAAEAQELSALICITKADLVQHEGRAALAGLSQVVQEYRRIGYAVALTSAATAAGLDELRDALRGKTSALLGKSGVGKTSLLNALQPGLGLRVSAVSQATGKGRHTTSHLQMHLLDCAGDHPGSAPTAILDTPGVREFGLWEIEADALCHCFPEMRPYIGLCRFGLDCSHDEEPGCIIRRAVMNGQISPRRYQSFLRLRAEL
jgi:ribosome biogenesis GTPase